MLNFCRSVYKPMSENIFKEYHKFFSLQEQFEETKGGCQMSQINRGRN